MLVEDVVLGIYRGGDFASYALEDYWILTKGGTLGAIEILTPRRAHQVLFGYLSQWRHISYPLRYSPREGHIKCYLNAHPKRDTPGVVDMFVPRGAHWTLLGCSP